MPVTKEDFEKLPRWAVVAFAARCARRVQPLFKAGWPDAPGDSIRAVEHAVDTAEGRALTHLNALKHGSGRVSGT